MVAGRPVSALTSAFLTLWADRVQERGQRAVLVIWDNASWHDSPIVRTWVRQHNRQGKLSGQGGRLSRALLPSKSPGLTPLEPQWLHGTPKVMAPDRLLTSAECSASPGPPGSISWGPISLDAIS